MGTRTAPCTASASQEKAISHLVAEAPTHTHTPTLSASLSSHPLLSIFAAACILGVLYLPRHLLSFLLSPFAVSTLLLLATLLHFGSSAARLPPQPRPPQSQHHAHSEKNEQQQQPEPSPLCASVPSFPHKPVCWAEHHHLSEFTRLGPLEVIYEEYEEEDDDDGVDSPPGGYQPPGRGWRQASEGMEAHLGLRFSTEDSDDDLLSECSGMSSSSLEWNSPENLCFRWEVEEDALIEIPLDEDNLIDIDLSVCR